MGSLKGRAAERPGKRVSQPELKAIAAGSAEVRFVGETVIVTSEDRLYQLLAEELLEYRARWEDRP